MITNTINRSCNVAMMLALSIILPATAHAINYTAKSEAAIRGGDSGLNAQFSSILTNDNYVTVEILLGNNTRIVTEIDYTARTVSIKSMSQKDGAPVNVTIQDRFLINMLRKSLGPVPAKTGDALASTLGFLSEVPPNTVVNVFAGEGSVVQPQVVESLCDQTGDIITGTYNTCRINPRTRRCVRGTEQTFEETEQLGPCYNESNECLGRCGPGCNAPPSSTIQRFAQDCFNHDLCTRSTGSILGPCRDEWVAAADDFFFAADCGSMTGEWSDNEGSQNEALGAWSLTQSPSLGGVISGRLDHGGSCGTWTVTGTHLGADVSLTATNPTPENRCCTSLTYTGTLNSCGTASGTWTNEGDTSPTPDICGLHGEWSMSRQGATLGVHALPLPEGTHPASSDKQ